MATRARAAAAPQGNPSPVMDPGNDASNRIARTGAQATVSGAIVGISSWAVDYYTTTEVPAGVWTYVGVLLTIGVAYLMNRSRAHDTPPPEPPPAQQ